MYEPFLVQYQENFVVLRETVHGTCGKINRDRETFPSGEKDFGKYLTLSQMFENKATCNTSNPKHQMRRNI
jgi:hypothetical protein